ncbi:membrane protein [Mycoavidus sp. B2-EB]|nr:membrane protein [Mycoavidus sp. B2-EB]
MNFSEKKMLDRKTSFGATSKAIFWSFMGIRKSRDSKQDAERLNPLHVLIAALIGASLFITVLIVVAKLAIKVVSAH